MNTVLIKNAKIVNEGVIFEGDVLIEGEFITEIAENISHKSSDCQVIDAEGNYLIPGAITQLGPLLVGDTVLVVQPAGDGASWLWTVAPSIASVEAWLESDDVRTRIETLAEAVVQAVLVSQRNEIAFEPTLGAFGVQQGNIRYTGAFVDGARSGTGLVHAVASELEAMGRDVELFASAALRALVRRLEPAELCAFAREELPTTGSETVRALLLEALERVSSRTEAA